jgi:hypothetical protein
MAVAAGWGRAEEGQGAVGAAICTAGVPQQRWPAGQTPAGQSWRGARYSRKMTPSMDECSRHVCLTSQAEEGSSFEGDYGSRYISSMPDFVRPFDASCLGQKPHLPFLG